MRRPALLAPVQTGGTPADGGSHAPGYNRSFFMTPTAETRLRVRYAETDQMGVVYYANYLVWMEVGRVELCKACGFSYRDMEIDDGVLLAVAEAQCRYRAPARFDDEVIVKTWIAEANSRVVTFAYEVRLADSETVLATGTTRHLFVNRQMERTRMPDKYRRLFGLDSGRAE
ncbi:MAG TPA: thioesterase family protein [Bryobacteraceae bacterium]|jgi:acyl-CoA thioester hydrolase